MLKACEVVTVLQQLKDFLPCEVIDAHAHIYDASFTPALRGNSMFEKHDRMRQIALTTFKA